MSELSISLLGTYQILRGSAPVNGFESNKVRALLAYLAVESDRPHPRDALAALLWPESSQGPAFNSLRNAIANLRGVIGDREARPPYLIITRETIQFNRESDACLDVARVIQQASRPQADIQTCIAAVNSYHGPFLEGLSISDSAAFEEWASLRREQLAQEILKGLRCLADYYESRGDYVPALEFAHRQVALEPWMEEGHCQIMRLLALSGQREGALRQYQTLREILHRDLGAAPTETTTRTYNEILSGGYYPVLARVQNPNNLPVQATSFIGREKEIETLKQVILSGKTRLVTVTGAGGTGKTRLALRVAEDVLNAYPQGIWLVELAAVVDPNLVPATVASALNLREIPEKTIDQVVVDFLRSKRMLLLLDTCEHLVGTVASLVDQILRAAPLVSVLTTSREILGISGEMSFLCPSLALPGGHASQPHAGFASPAELLSCEAVRLFADRSALASQAFTVTEKNAAIVAQVCRRLDGIPLAIELAAARTRLLSIEQIAERLDHSFQLLTGGSRTALPRQQTLSAMIDWSYNLLSATERALLLRLSVFMGGWSLEAAEAVCAGNATDSENIRRGEILDGLGRLVDKSLILVESGFQGEPRYRMLDTIHQYAHDRLLESGGESTLRDSHLAYFMQLAEKAQPNFRAKAARQWLDRLEMELGNLRLALEWSLTGPVEQGLRLGGALMSFWHIRSRRFEGIQWLERLLDADSTGQPIQLRPPARRLARGVALLSAGNLNYYYPGINQEHAQAQTKEGLVIIQDSGEMGQSCLPFALFNAANTEEDVRVCLGVARKVGDELYAAECIATLGRFECYRGDLVQAAAYFAENMELRKKMGDVEGEGWAYYLLAELAYMSGHPERASEFYSASQSCLKAVENFEFALFISGFPARLAITQGEYRRALEIGERQLAAGQDITSTLVTADALGNLGWAAWAVKADDLVARRCEEVLGADWENCLPCGRGTLFYVFGRMALSRGDFNQARSYLSHFAAIAAPERYLSIQAIGILASMTGQARRAAVIFGALDGFCGWLKHVISPVEQDEYEQALESTRSALGSGAFQVAWGEGAAFNQEQAFAYVSEGLDRS